MIGLYNNIFEYIIAIILAAIIWIIGIYIWIKYLGGDKPVKSKKRINYNYTDKEPNNLTCLDCPESVLYVYTESPNSIWCNLYQMSVPMDAPQCPFFDKPCLLYS